MDPGAALAYAALGVFVGAYGTLVGAGGGFIVVPVLLLGLHWEPDRAVGTSLFVVTANAVSGSLAYARQKRIDYRTALAFAAATIPGAILGAFVVHQLSGRAFRAAFGVVLILVSVRLMVRSAGANLRSSTDRPPGWRGWGWTVRRLVDRGGEEFDYAYPMPWGVLLSVVVGFLSSILGIGGGTIHVPALVAFFRFPAHVATATSHFILGISAATGTASHMTLGNVVLGPALAMAAGAIVGAQIGGALSRKVKPTFIVRGLAGALTLVGIRLLLA